MNLTASSLIPAQIVYPESDGKPMSDNTKQGHWIILIFDNLDALFAAVADVFVAQNLLWYPVEGHPELCGAPDVLVVFGRPKHHRGSYMTWQEGDIPLTVVFEILSPGNSVPEMADKHAFYEEHGVEEYYVYDPDRNHLAVYVRRGGALRRVRPADGFTSPRLRISFDLSGEELVIRRPDGTAFQVFRDVYAERERERQRSARLAELSRKARRNQATPEELVELDRLEEETAPPSP